MDGVYLGAGPLPANMFSTTADLRGLPEVLNLPAYDPTLIQVPDSGYWESFYGDGK